MQAEPAARRPFRTKLLDRLTPTIVHAKLTAMAAMFNWRPSLRHHLRDDGFSFDATLEFVTSDGGAGVHAIFKDGTMHVRSGRPRARTPRCASPPPGTCAASSRAKTAWACCSTTCCGSKGT